MAQRRPFLKLETVPEEESSDTGSSSSKPEDFLEDANNEQTDQIAEYGPFQEYDGEKGSNEFGEKERQYSGEQKGDNKADGNKSDEEKADRELGEGVKDKETDKEMEEEDMKSEEKKDKEKYETKLHEYSMEKESGEEKRSEESDEKLYREKGDMKSEEERDEESVKLHEEKMVRESDEKDKEKYDKDLYEMKEVVESGEEKRDKEKDELIEDEDREHDDESGDEVRGENEHDGEVHESDGEKENSNEEWEEETYTEESDEWRDEVDSLLLSQEDLSRILEAATEGLEVKNRPKAASDPQIYERVSEEHSDYLEYLLSDEFKNMKHPDVPFPFYRTENLQSPKPKDWRDEVNEIRERFLEVINIIAEKMQKFSETVDIISTAFPDLSKRAMQRMAEFASSTIETIETAREELLDILNTVTSARVLEVKKHSVILLCNSASEKCYGLDFYFIRIFSVIPRYQHLVDETKMKELEEDIYICRMTLVAVLKHLTSIKYSLNALEYDTEKPPENVEANDRSSSSNKIEDELVTHQGPSNANGSAMEDPDVIQQIQDPGDVEEASGESNRLLEGQVVEVPSDEEGTGRLYVRYLASHPYLCAWCSVVSLLLLFAIMGIVALVLYSRSGDPNYSSE